MKKKEDRLKDFKAVIENIFLLCFLNFCLEFWLDSNYILKRHEGKKKRWDLVVIFLVQLYICYCNYDFGILSSFFLNFSHLQIEIHKLYFSHFDSNLLPLNCGFFSHANFIFLSLFFVFNFMYLSFIYYEHGTWGETEALEST